jgi:hypothetical protein
MFFKNFALGTNKPGSGVEAIHDVGNHAILVIQGNCILVKRLFLYVCYRGYRVLLNRLKLVEARTHDRRILQDCSGFLVEVYRTGRFSSI